MTTLKVYAASEVGALARLIQAAEEYAANTTGKQAISTVTVDPAGEHELDKIILRFA
jgi:hypothetical protein